MFGKFGKNPAGIMQKELRECLICAIITWLDCGRSRPEACIPWICPGFFGCAGEDGFNKKTFLYETEDRFMAKKVVLAGACRTAIGTMGGTLSTTPAADLGAIVIKEALNRAGVDPAAVDQVYMGCVIQAGQGQNVARQASIKAGLPIEVPAVTINVVCGSGLNCVNMAAQMIQAGDADIVVAGGMENMSMAPYAVMQGRYGYRMNDGKLVDTMIKDALWDAFNDYHMIKTADNIAEQWGLTREELDEFSAKS